VLVWCEQGLRAKLRKEEELLNTLQLRVFTNDYVPTVSSDFSDFVEGNWPGYGPVLLKQWGTPVVVSPGLVGATEVVHTFEWDGTGPAPLAYGYYVVHPLTLDLYYAVRDPRGAFQFSTDDREYSILPIMQVRNFA
jgi:hypothetical protein